MRAIRGCVVVALGLLSSACNVVVATVPVVPLAPPGVEVRPDVAAGYEQYSAALSPWGTWEPDVENGVRWCPREDVLGPEEAFTPYVSRGHWGLSQAAIGKSPAGSLTWESEDPDTWGTITTHHGFWVHDQRWCWVPGAEEVAARVIWRWGDGFVGWVPEPPDCVAYDDVEYEALDWFFTLLGTLLEGHPSDNRLDGDAAAVARSASAPAHGPAGEPVKSSRSGPPAQRITDARTALAAYATVHGQTIAQAAERSLATKAGSGSSGSSSSSKSSSSSAKKGDVPLTAGVYYDAMLMDPVYLPARAMPRLPVRALPAAGPYAAAAGREGGVGSAISAMHAGGHAARGAASRPSRAFGSAVVYHPSSSSSRRSSSSSGSRSSHKSSSHTSHRSHR